MYVPADRLPDRLNCLPVWLRRRGQYYRTGPMMGRTFSTAATWAATVDASFQEEYGPSSTTYQLRPYEPAVWMSVAR